jgi:hypothetical protein
VSTGSEFLKPDLQLILRLMCYRLHVFADIRPYICIISSCKVALCTFASRNQLADHEINYHSMKSQGPLGNDGLLDQKFKFPGGRDMLDTISTPEDSFSCPLCRKDLSSSKRTYISHLAKHMESIALATLPPDPEDMSGDESGFSDQSDESVQDAEENYPREPTHSSFRSNMEGAARKEENNPYNHNFILESPKLWDNGNDYLDSRESDEGRVKLDQRDEVREQNVETPNYEMGNDPGKFYLL